MNDTFRYANAITSSKPVYLRDADKYEAELATSQEESDEDNLDTENPTPKDNGPEHNWEKRFSDLQSYMDKKINNITASKDAVISDLQQKLKEVESKPKTYPVSDEEIAEWAASFPDFNKTLTTIVSKITDAKGEELRKELARLEESQKAYAAEKGWQELLKYHPDANEIKDDPQFATWFGEQKPRIQGLINSTDPQEVARGISLYKDDLGIKPVQKNRSERDASQAIAVNSRPDTPQPKKQWLESEVARMHTRTYEKYEKDIDQARKEGRFTYDMSSL